ncbi:MAG: hypothetical protein ACI4I1_11915 [Oscillospiraceae bacterium]
MENSKQSISMAEKRVEEMNRLTQGLLEQSNRYMQQRNRQQGRPQNNMNRTTSAPPPKPRFETVGKSQQEKPIFPPKTEPPTCADQKPAPTIIGGANSDTALIIMLAAVLLKENADIKLILALLYILM